MGRMDGKVVFITGAARGQGRAHAVRLAEEGAAIVATDICAPVAAVPYAMASEEDLAETVRQVEALGGRIVAATADVRDQAALDAAVARGVEAFGQIDGLIANAGVVTFKGIFDLDDQEWDAVIDTVLGGVFRAAKAVVPGMIERRQGAIVLTASTSGYEATPLGTHYAAAKHGVIGLMRTLAVELGPHGIRVNAICPGPTDTPMLDWPGAFDLMTGNLSSSRDEAAEAARNWTVLPGRGLLPVLAQANGALFLLSDESADITGMGMPIDAGHGALPGFNPAPPAPR